MIIFVLIKREVNNNSIVIELDFKVISVFDNKWNLNSNFCRCLIPGISKLSRLSDNVLFGNIQLSEFNDLSPCNSVSLVFLQPLK